MAWEDAGGGGTDISVRAYNNAAIAVANATSVPMTFNNESFDTNCMHATTGCCTSRLIAKTAGKYIITGTVRWQTNNTGVRNIWVKLNGSSTLEQLQVDGDIADNPMQNISVIHNLDACDYVELIAYQTSGGSLNVETAGVNSSPTMSMAKILG